MFFFIRAYQVYTSSAEIQPHLLVVHSDMGRSVVSISRVVEYPCLASPGSSRTDYAMPNHSSVSAGIQAQTSRRSDWRAERVWGSGHAGGTSNNFVAVGRSRVFCVGLLLARLVFLCVYCAASSAFPSAPSSNRQTLVLFLCTMVRVKRRVGTAVLFLPRKAAARPSACVAAVEVARLKQQKNLQDGRKEAA